MGIYNYDKTASNNDAIQGITITDGVMRTNNVDNCFQALSSDIARLRDDQAGQLISTGTGGNYAITSNSTITAYAAGMRFHFEANHTATGAATFNVDLIGAKPIYKRGTIPIQANEIMQGGHYIVQYDASQDAFIILNWQSADVGHQHTLADVTDSGALAAKNTVGTADIDTKAVTLGLLADGPADSLRGHNNTGEAAIITVGTGLQLTGNVLSSGAGTYLHARHTTTSGDGGTANTGWNTRPLNTEVLNSISGASLATNQITLPVGTYKVSGSQSLFRTQDALTRLRNITDSSTEMHGVNGWANSGGSYGIVTTMQGILTVTGASKTFEFQYRAGIQRSGDGLGVDGPGVDENVFADLLIEKIA